jgi:transcriptional regulator with XRE-family HTH domain
MTIIMIEAPKYQKKNQQLPKEVHEFFSTPGLTLSSRDGIIRSLADADWTFEAIAGASGITRERVRQISKTQHMMWPADPKLSEHSLDIPEPPIKFEKPKREYIEPSPKTLQRLLELQPYAQQVRSNGTKYREEAEEYTALLNHAHTVEEVTLYRLAKRLGITHGAIRFRLVRYGYKKAITATSKVYMPIIRDNRALDGK